LKKPSWRVVLTWLLLVLFLASTAAAIFFFLQWRDLDEAEQKRDEALSAASEFVTALTNFSYETIDEDVEEIRDFAVGDFAEEAETFFGADGVQAIKDAEAVSEAETESIFIQALDGDEASVFAVVTETISNALTDEPQTDVLRLEVGMIETSSGWKVNRVDVFQAPGSGILPQN
jgi:hypothetical protein